MAQGGPGEIETGPARGESNWKVSGFPTVLVPANSLLKQEQLQLAQASFRNTRLSQLGLKPIYVWQQVGLL